MGKIILIAGLPGSGKTTYGSWLKDEIQAKCYLDDYHANAIDDDPAFQKARGYVALIQGLKRGETWIASDIEWCRPERRREAESQLRRDVPEVVIEWHFLVVDKEVCRKRVRERGDRDEKTKAEELRKIDELSQVYEVPPGAHIVAHGAYDAPAGDE